MNRRDEEWRRRSVHELVNIECWLFDSSSPALDSHSPSEGREGGGKNPEKECLHLPLSFFKG